MLKRDNTQANPAIILCGGNINYSNLPIATNVSNAMIPVNGKPVIGWILDELISQELNHIIIVVQSRHRQLISFLEWAYSKKTHISFAFVEPGGTIVHSLLAGLQNLEGDGNVSVVLGDTLVKDRIDFSEDYVLVADYEDPTIWCLTETDEQKVVTAYYDKQKIYKPGLQAIVGFYHFTDSSSLVAACSHAIGAGERELSAALSRYGKTQPVKALPTHKWYDFGHISHFLEAKREFLQSRFFNRLIINQVQGTIEKISTLTGKLEDELAWYESLPEDLKILSPRILEKGRISDKEYRIVQEYYGYPNMAELLLYGNLDIEIWKTAINNLLHTHEFLKRHKGNVTAEDAEAMYLGKTWERLDMLSAEDEFFRDLLLQPELTVNGKTVRNLPGLKKEISRKAEKLCSTVQGCVIHGDYCLSNILYDINNQIIRLVDPRGSFGKKGVYGDPRYDMAKLRHSIGGGYDYVIADLFSLEYEGTKFSRELFRNELDSELGPYLDRRISESGYDLDEIKFIEGLLFLSMVPLHKDKPGRQKMMYLRAIELFNEIFSQITHPL